MGYVVVAYYTEHTGYEKEIQHLITSLEKFNLPMDIVGIPPQGSHQQGVHHKPYFIKQMLIRHYPKDVLYLDADARVQRYPDLFNKIDFDLGVFVWREVELIASTLYFANRPKVMELIDRWIACCLQYPDTWDQKLLQYLLQEEVADLQLNVRFLPPEYCKIFDLMDKEVADPVIEQFQASRRFRKEVDEKGRDHS